MTGMVRQYPAPDLAGSRWKSDAVRRLYVEISSHCPPQSCRGRQKNAAGQVIPIFAARYPMALYGHTETLVPYLYVSAPLIAFGYLIWQWRRRQA
jgi:hypothetical protein